MIKPLFNKLLSRLGYRIVKNKTREDQAFLDQFNRLDLSQEVVIFDVGSYDGEIAKRYHKLTKGKCRIFSFEPFPDSFDSLQKNVEAWPAIKPFKLALSNVIGESVFRSNKFAATNSLLPTHAEGAKNWQSDVLSTLREIIVPVTTLDEFVLEHNLSRIDILKMDTQGSEFMVLEGALESLKKGLIKMIYTEIIVMPTYEGQKHLDEVLGLIRGYGYTLINLYQSSDKKGNLRYLDALFIHKDY